MLIRCAIPRTRWLYRTMASSSPPSLPQVPGSDPSNCALDSFRIAIAQRVSDALPPLTLEQAYSGVDYGKKGVDFTIALPRYKLPGKVDELANKVVSKVSHDPSYLYLLECCVFLQYDTRMVCLDSKHSNFWLSRSTFGAH